MLETSSQDKEALATVMCIYVNYQAMEKSHHDDQEWHTQSTLIHKNADTCLPIFPLRIKRKITPLLLHCPQETKFRHSSFLAITLVLLPSLKLVLASFSFLSSSIQMPKLNTIYHISCLKGNQTKEESHASPIERNKKIYTQQFSSWFVISFVKNQHSTSESFQNITMSDVILCHVVCINDVINNASIHGESIKFVTSQPFFCFSLLQSHPTWLHPKIIGFCAA